MAVLQPTPVSTRQFSFDQTTQTFTAEVSDLGRDFRFGRVYDDACDAGLTLVSARSGSQIVFCVEHEERDSEGDLLYWVLRPVSRQYRHLTVRLYND